MHPWWMSALAAHAPTRLLDINWNSEVTKEITNRGFGRRTVRGGEAADSGKDVMDGASSSGCAATLT
jgi:hypothetical protein